MNTLWTGYAFYETLGNRASDYQVVYKDTNYVATRILNTINKETGKAAKVMEWLDGYEKSRWKLRARYFNKTLILNGTGEGSYVQFFNWGSVPKQPPSIIEYYLREAIICLDQEVYRMSVVASACALNFGLDFVLRERKLVGKKRVLSLDGVIGKVEKQVLDHNSKMLSKSSLRNCIKVRERRNAFVHPEKYLEVTPSIRGSHFYTLKPSFTTTQEKKEAYTASQANMKRQLKTIAQETLEIAFNSIKEALENLLLP